MEFTADLHLHSHFSRATSKNLDLEHIYQASILKGITVVGTGDFTHPGWFQELEDKLEPAEEGLFKLKDKVLKDANKLSFTDVSFDKESINSNKFYDTFQKSIRFILQCEISSIYKKDGKVRKNHNLIYFPDMAGVKLFNEKLGKIGNITSDGRPILGLDCQKLLEIALETSEDCFMIPAHIWTPWFSMFGSKSGFDSVEECFGSLSCHIFAIETGLSSDLPMNWRVENLDKMSFISSSDAHSPMFMGRNASCFNTELSYKSIRDALKTPLSNLQPFNNQNSNNIEHSYLGTIDMYPEEGKYHYDGHRKCGVCFSPSETLNHKGICPKCGKPLTVGVLYRVEELASRPEGYIPKNRHGYQTIIPLAEILSEICGTGTKAKKVGQYYAKAVTSLGPELDILLKKEIDEIDKAGIPLLSEAIRRMRNREIHLSPGYDGEFGRITLFTPEEREKLKGWISMFKGKSAAHLQSNQHKLIYDKSNISINDKSISGKSNILINDKLFYNNSPKDNLIYDNSNNKCKNQLNQEQQNAVNSKNRPIIIEAGPGTGKTHAITEKIASLIVNDNVNPESILALTFTEKAAKEMKQRIDKLSEQNNINKISNNLDSQIPDSLDNQSISKDKIKSVFVSTFHGFCLMVLKKYTNFEFAIADETLRKALIEHAIKLAFPDSIKSKKTAIPDSSKSKKTPLSQIELDIAVFKQLYNIKISSLGSSSTHQIDLQKLNGETLPNLNSETLLILQKYQELLASYKLVDFEDLIVMVLNVLQHNNKYDGAITNIGIRDGDILSKIKERFNYIFVDEYQDVNKSQYELIKLIAGDGKKLCVIGDPDQAIYGFRGADNRYFKRFEKDYPNTETIVFKRNYRSTETILEASFQLIKQNYNQIKYLNQPQTIEQNKSQTIEQNKLKERLFSGIYGEQTINILETASEEAEAAVIGKTIERLVGGISMFSMDSGKVDTSLKDQYSFSDIAVLYRTKKQSEILSKVFEKAGIPFQTADRDNIFLQKGIKEIISSFRILTGIGTIYDFEVMSIHKKGEYFIKNNKSRYFKESNVQQRDDALKSADILKIIIDELEIDKIINKNKKTSETAELLIKESENYPDPALFYEHIAMKKDIDTVEHQAEKVSLMTMHASKGLEFKIVFAAGCENGLIPFLNHKGKCENIDEERRLFYVAMTRAKDALYLSYAKKRLIFGKQVEVARSPFLNNIEENIKKYSKSKFKRKESAYHDPQLDLF